MKTVSLIAIAVLLSGKVHAAPATEQLISTQTLKIGDGIEVTLPLVKLADGSVCQSYVSEASRVAESRLVSFKVSRVCGVETHASNAQGGEDVRPANLLGMRTFTSDGLTIQLPDIKISG